MKCNIKILWSDIVARDALFEALVPHTEKFSVTTEIDDGVYWLGADNQEHMSVNVCAAALNYQPSGLADRVVELYRTRGVRYVALNLEGVSQDNFHRWLRDVQSRVSDPIFVFDPTIGGPYFDQLIQDLNNGVSRIPERTFPSTAPASGVDEEGHW